MKIDRYYFDIIENAKNTHEVMPVPKEKVKGEVEYPCHLFLDQSTKTGYVIVDDKRRLVEAGHVAKQDKDSLEDYKFGLKDIIEDLIEQYKVKMVWYEEAYDRANHWTTEVLYYIKHMIQDIGYHYGDEIKVLGLDHARWKSLLARPGKFKRTGDDKKQIKKLVNDIYPLINLPEDTMDALGMAIAIIWKQQEKKVYYNARINKKLPIHVEVLTLKKGECIEEKITKLGKRFTRKMIDEEKGYDYYEYNIEYDELLNCRYVLSFRDTVCWSRIPEHRNLGMIMLHYGIVPKKLEEDEDIIIIACRKK